MLIKSNHQYMLQFYHHLFILLVLCSFCPYLKIRVANYTRLFVLCICTIFKNSTKYNKRRQKIQMSYSRLQIQSLISRNKKRNQPSKSPPQGALSPKSNQLNRSNSPKELTQRYQQLCTKYKQLLEEVKDKNHLYQLQQMQLDKLKLERQRDHKQLFRLRSMIGFIKKEDKGMQVNMDMQSAGSWSTKIEKSTIIQGQQEMDWPLLKQPEPKRLSRRKSPKQQVLYSPTNANKTSGFKQQSQINDLYTKGYENENSRIKTESIYSPKTSEKQLNTIMKIRESRNIETKYKQLSNSPYSKLRFSRKIQ